jgi:hypothetical protein
MSASRPAQTRERSRFRWPFAVWRSSAVCQMLSLAWALWRSLQSFDGPLDVGRWSRSISARSDYGRSGLCRT